MLNQININRNIDEIFTQIYSVDNSYIALKLSGLGIENDKNCYKLIDQFYNENNNKNHPNQFLIDAEYFSIQDKIYNISDYALNTYNTKDKKYFYKTLQMYRNDVSDVFNNDVKNLMNEEKYALKLVRGAYYSDKKYNIINSTKELTDNQYDNTLKIFFEKMEKYPNNELIVATHNKKVTN